MKQLAKHQDRLSSLFLLLFARFYVFLGQLAIICDNLLVFRKLEHFSTSAIFHFGPIKLKVPHLPVLVLDRGSTLRDKLFKFVLPTISHLEERVFVCRSDLKVVQVLSHF